MVRATQVVTRYNGVSGENSSRHQNFLSFHVENSSLITRILQTARTAAQILLGVTLLTSAIALQAQTRDLDQPVRVSVASLQSLAVAQRKSANATVVAANRAVVAAQVAASIIDISTDVGSQVKKGQDLARLDPLDYQLALEQAKAQLNATNAQITQAQLRLDRANQLSGSQYISADDLLARQTDLAVAKATKVSQEVAIKIAQRNLDKTRVQAPFAATVVARPGQLGSLAVAGTPLFELVQLDQREIEARVASDLVSGLRDGSRVRFERNGQFYHAEVLRISPIADASSGTQIVRLKFTADSAVIGSSGRLSWASPGQQLAPSYLSLRNGELGVFVVEQNRARFHRLPAAQEGRAFVVDLDGDVKIVTTGRTKLQDGQALTILDSE